MTQHENKTTRKSPLFTALLVASLASGASAGDLYVDDVGQQCPYPSYSSIQEAVDHSWPGCVIYIYAGTYTGSGNGAVVQINSYDLDLIGVGDVVIDGEGLNRCVRATGPTDYRAPIRLHNITLANGDAGNGSGGGIHATGRVFLDLCEVVNCTADNGGGIAVAPPTGAPANEHSYMHMSLTLVTGCSADKNGGGIYLNGDSAMMTESCWILDNSAGRNGGGFAMSGGSNLGSLQILNYNCVLDPNDLLQGQLLPGSSISGNRASKSGGGIYINAGGLNLMEGDVLNNRAGETGGGVSLRNGILHMGWRGPVLIGQNVVGEAPGVPLGNGGGLFAENATVLGDVTLNSTSGATPHPVTFQENVAYGRGGGVFAKQCERIDLEETTFELNRAYGHGGGMFVNSCDDFDIKASRFLYNVGGVGGALLIKDNGSGTYDIDSTALHYNIGVMNGGANGGALVVSGVGASAKVSSCDFVQNLKRHIMAIAGASLLNGGMNSFN
jgi:predicted outer membrane repeat protein